MSFLKTKIFTQNILFAIFGCVLFFLAYTQVKAEQCGPTFYSGSWSCAMVAGCCTETNPLCNETPVVMCGDGGGGCVGIGNCHEVDANTCVEDCMNPGGTTYDWKYCDGCHSTPPPDSSPPPENQQPCSCGCGGSGSCSPNCACGNIDAGHCADACCTGNCGGGGGGGPAQDCNGVPRSQAPSNCCDLQCRGSVSCIWNVNTNDWLCDDPGWFCAGGGNANNWSACTGACGAGTQTNDCGTTQSCCIECGPHWSACRSSDFSRTATYDCLNVPTTQACTGTITGTFFDATEIDSCAQMALAPKIPGGRLSATATANSPAITYRTNGSNNSGVYAISTVRSPETYALDTDMSEVNPALGKYLSVPRFVCQSSTATFTGQSETVTRDFGFWKVYDSWYQVMGGSLRAEGTNNPAIQSHVPPTCTAANSCNPFVLTRDASSTPESAGYALTGRESTSMGTVVSAYSGGDLSKLNEDTHQVVGSSKRRQFKENYDYFINKLYSMGVSPTSDYSPAQLADLQRPLNSPINNGRKAYYANGNATIQTAWNVANGESYVIFVNGTLTIKNTITVAPGGFLAFITKGDITIDPSVGTTTYTSTTPQVEGVYVTDGIFTVETAGNGTTKVHDKKFVGAGTFVGWSGISLKRDYRDTATPDLGLNNNTAPTELFITRPDLQFSAPKEMLRPLYGWEEVAP